MDRRHKSSREEELRAVLAELECLRGEIERARRTLLHRWRPYLRTETRASTSNLAAYIALRRHDLRELQLRLAALGLSSLGRCEGHVLASLDALIAALRHMLGGRIPEASAVAVRRAMQRDAEQLRRRTSALFGPSPPARWTRFLVTLPSEAAEDPAFVHELVLRGMDCARINLAHDDAAAWERMVAHVRAAARETGRRCGIFMDLGGPKLRTGSLASAPPLLHLKVRRDPRGRLVRPAEVILDGSTAPGRPASTDHLGRRSPARLAVEAGWVAALEPGDDVTFRDLQGRRRRLRVAARLAADAVHCVCEEGSWLAEGTELEHRRAGVRTGGAGARTRTGRFLAPPVEIRVRPGDPLHLSRDPAPGTPACLDEAGHVVAPARVPCSEPEVFRFLEPGQRVWIDDGRVEARIEAVDADGARLVVTRARPQGDRIGEGKGLNFPESSLALPALGERDLADLDFAARHADLVGLSFVQGPSDVDRLVEEIERRTERPIGVVAKIETEKGIAALPEIIVHGMARHPFGIMIARGDLAVEIGYERLAEMQEEILWLCEAAHVPVIWATQVLETLVKQHLPSRAEITDAAMAERAECILLNKGPYVFDALAVLESVVARMERHQRKKTAQLRALHWWERIQTARAPADATYSRKQTDFVSV